MDTFVVDCSVAAKWVLPEPGHDAALDLYRRFELAEITLIAPDLLPIEFASLVAKRTRRKELSIVSAQAAFETMMASVPPLIATQLLLRQAMSLSLRDQISLWDCVYLALAIERECPLLTADRRLFRSGQMRHLSIQLFP